MPASSSQVSSPRGISSQGQRRVAIAATKATTSAAVPQDETLEEETREELYTSMRTNVVGIQYYKGWFGGPGEEVILNREPHNPYDRNAIQVLNISRTQVGHLPMNVASKLAPLLDQHLVNCEAIIHDGNLSGFRGYTLDLTIRFYAAADKRALIQPKLIWATPGQRGFGQTTGPVSSSSGGGTNAPGPSQQRKSHVTANTKAQIEAALKQEEARQKAAELSRILNTLEKVDDEGRRSSLLDSVCASDDVLNLPLHPDPPGIAKGDLLVDLMKHQYPVLPKKESDKPVQFWQLRQNPTKKSSYYFNIATKTPMAAPPVLGRGALFADAMASGKTLTMLALILATKKDKPAHFSNATLIVVRQWYFQNWEKQIQDHCSPGALKAHVYYGPGRSVSAEDLGQFDVVITTYQVCVTEHTDFKPEDGPSKKKRKGGKPLFGVQWKRIILDEGHCIRNPKTKMAKAVCAVPAERRWVLTGTPIDLGSIMTFLKICQPLDNEDFFKRLLLRPLKNGAPAGAELLRALMSHICIRRTKEMQDSSGNPLIPLPPVEMTLVPVALLDDARVGTLREVENLSKQRIQGYISRGEAKTMQSNVLSMLTRMRQISLHPGLVPKNYIDELRAMLDSDDKSKPRVALRPEDKVRLQSQLLQAIEDSEECPICLDVPDSINARITSCAHVFCIQCITEILSRQGKCPMDRQEISIADVIEPPPPTELTQMQYHTEEETFEGGSSAKIDQLIHLLTLLPVTEKSLVFSQFTTFLDKIAEELDTRGIPYERFDGRMSAKKRQEVLARFSIPFEEPKQVEESMEVEQPRRRKAKASRRVVADDSDDFPMNNLDSDFTPLPQDNSDNDDDFVVSDSDDDSYTRKKLKGKGKAKPKSKSKGKTFLQREDLAFGSGENAKVLLLSLKAGALGLNLTVANNVFLWWQEGIESQAIDRVNRIGQKKAVHVYQLIAENTVEAKVLEIQEKKKALIKQAFSEARLQEIVELFGLRNSQVPPVLD
ncbi:SNF2 family N-terminal domain-containing protein [Mucidula mucida]|nr:SNF2 family N-terminal domain-containing protein [Mucidula mucida]